MELDLPFIWAGLIATAIYIYVVLDGFDLGIGILFPWIRGEQDRDVAVNSVAPVWDGNETWLILGGGGLFAAFPLAYAVLMPALYAPITAMLLALVFRGVAFEFRFRSENSKHWWDRGFWLGSTVAAFSQGVCLGTVIQGVNVAGRAYAGGWWDWLTPFSILTGVALVAGYALLGICWLIMKTTGDLRKQLYAMALPAGGLVLAMIGIVSLWTPFLSNEIFERWFAWPNILYVSPVPLLVLALAFIFHRAVLNKRDPIPFFATLGLFLVSYAGLAISLYPWMVPRAITIWEAAAPAKSQMFLLIGTVVLLPLILGYTAYAYWVFRGKVDPDEGYH
ncbi:MAG: cytochrome d ubiquinol oxidase subunit II [Hyphomicrobiaceae bacterium]